MYTLILIMYVQYAATTINVAQTTLPERYKNGPACETAGNKLNVKTSEHSPVSVGINDIRVGYICVESGTIKPLS
jgi:hypothetical protein